MKILFYAVLVSAAFASGCGGDPASEPSKTETPKSVETPKPVESPKTESVAGNVVMRNMQFSPATLEIKAGDTVEWKNDDLVAHTVTSSTFDSGSIAPDHSWQHTFSGTGEISYRCSFHPTMKARVVIK